MSTITDRPRHLMTLCMALLALVLGLGACSANRPTLLPSSTRAADRSRNLPEFNGPNTGEHRSFASETCLEAGAVGEVLGKGVTLRPGFEDPGSGGTWLSCIYGLDDEPQTQSGSIAPTFRIDESPLELDLDEAYQDARKPTAYSEGGADGLRDAPSEFGAGTFETWIDGARRVGLPAPSHPQLPVNGVKCTLWVLGNPQDSVYEISLNLDQAKDTVESTCVSLEEIARYLNFS